MMYSGHSLDFLGATHDIVITSMCDAHSHPKGWIVVDTQLVSLYISPLVFACRA